ncbi:DNA internalization-related competence protein ComEC/Rec2 [Novilysobacter arseniciresistens]|uniref:DNA internalization-related competence protein ComEC/Rec2 n=1 Tax=Novilysobacter arseniciresistens TaxID=1385522 RepID=UPI0006914EB5|nr:DNA internalization-related competence protein ComEC/Rec2 [Lysobacter arseniciresistens]
MSTHDTSHATAPFGIAVALALLAGVAACLWLPELPPVWLLVATLPVGLLAWWKGGRLRWSGAALAGFALAGLHAAHALALQLPSDWEKREVAVTGWVVELPEHQPRRTSFAFRVDDTAAQPEPLRGRLLKLSWYDDFDGTSTGRDRLRAGQRWQLRVQVKAPRGLRNPGRFDSEKHAMADRVTAGGHVREPLSAQLQSAATGIDAWRERMSGRIAAAVPSDGSRFVRALALGDTRGLSDADWMTLRANGLTHLIAISGFHVGLVAGFAALLASAAWWAWPGLGRRCPRPVAMAVVGLLGAAGYAAVAGFALPTVRTVLMIAVVAGVRAARRPTSTFEALALAAIAILLVDPLAILGAGFWLSFFGVAWLLWCLPDAGQRPVRDLLSAQGVATVGLLPLAAVLFGEASLAGPVANLIAVPWWSLVVVPLSLLGTLLEAVHVGWGEWAWRLATWCFEASWPLFERFSASGLALWWLPEPRWFALPLAVLGAFWLLLPRGLPGKPLALLLWLPLLWPDRHLPANGEAELQVLDVGQGMAILVRTANHSLLYDMGPATPGYDAGERVVLPALRALGVRRLDRAVASHGDSDHAGGFDAVVAALPVDRTDAPEGAPVAAGHHCVAGTGWEWDGVEFRYLHPTPYFPYLGNEASCVLRISTAHGSALLTGDIGEVVERGLVRRATGDPASAIDADVVLVAHHGSGSASDPTFIAATSARHALVSNGHGNRFGHPKPDVVARWQASGARVQATAEGGALTVRLAPGGPVVETRRDAHPRLWDAARRAAGASGTAQAGLSYRPE